MVGEKKQRRLPSAKKQLIAKADGDRTHEGVSFPSPPSHASMPVDYLSTLNEIKEHIHSERLRVTMAANAAMVLLYWEIGRIILLRQHAEGWGTKVIERLSADLRESFPDMRGLSARNLKYMRAFSEAWPDRAIVQEALAQIPGITTSHCWKNVTLPKNASGMPAKQQRTVGRIMFSVSKSKVKHTSARVRLSTTLLRPCHPPIPTWPPRCSRIPTCSIF